MKKILFAILLLFFVISCQKQTEDNIQKNYESTAARIEGNAKSTTYSLSFQTGHQASECNGCVTINGRSFHVDCMGQGNACLNSSLVSLVQISGNSYMATTLDSTALTNEDFFNMPARSLFVEYDEKNNEVWLNIPAQLVYRDSSTNQFTFTNLYYSNAQIYGDN